MGLIKKAIVVGGAVAVYKHFEHEKQRKEVQQHQNQSNSNRGGSFDGVQSTPGPMNGHAPYCNGQCGGCCTASSKY
jgi:hypothetical protein